MAWTGPGPGPTCSIGAQGLERIQTPDAPGRQGSGQQADRRQDAAGQAIDWDGDSRRPNLIEDKCLSCMLCKFVCPVPGLITYKEMPADWKRQETAVMDNNLEKDVKIEPFTKEGPNECVI